MKSLNTETPENGIAAEEAPETEAPAERTENAPTGSAASEAEAEEDGAAQAGRELARLNPMKRLAVLEAVLFMASEPLKPEDLEEALGWPAALLRQDLLALADTFAGRGTELICSGGAWRITTSPQTAPWVERFLRAENRRRLSRAQMETLAIIAYRQPTTRAEIENYRGVRSDRALSQLEDLNLVKSMGRSPLPGHPIQYGTTIDFLRYFGLNSLEELPEISLEAELFRRIREPKIAEGAVLRGKAASGASASLPEGEDKAGADTAPAEPEAEGAAENGEAADPDLDAPGPSLKKLLNRIKKRRLAEEREAAKKADGSPDK